MSEQTFQGYRERLADARREWRSKPRCRMAVVQVEIVTQPPHSTKGSLVLVVSNLELDKFLASVISETAHLHEVKVSCLVPNVKWQGMDTYAWGACHTVWTA